MAPYHWPKKGGIVGDGGVLSGGWMVPHRGPLWWALWGGLVEGLVGRPCGGLLWGSFVGALWGPCRGLVGGLVRGLVGSLVGLERCLKYWGSNLVKKGIFRRGTNYRLVLLPMSQSYHSNYSVFTWSPLLLHVSPPSIDWTHLLTKALLVSQRAIC